MGRSEGKPLASSHLKGCSEQEMETGQKILKLFGTSGADDEFLSQLGPTRVAFADAFLNGEWKKEAEENHLALFEVKSENSINRIKGTAENPRFTERVTSGCRFDFCIGLKAFEGDEGLKIFCWKGCGCFRWIHSAGTEAGVMEKSNCILMIRTCRHALNRLLHCEGRLF